MKPNPRNRQPYEARATSFSAKMPFWWLTAALAASVATVGANLFLPDLVASVPWYNEALSERRNYVIFWLVLVLLGVLVQATSWILHRTRRMRT